MKLRGRAKSGEGETARRITEVVEALMMERGFNAISYADIAERIGIRKASIHYHFPTKADLGEAVIHRYADKMHGATPDLAQIAEPDFAALLEGFLAVFGAVAESPRKVCLGGVLGAEFETLPAGMRAEVRRFYAEAQSWLEALLRLGREAGAFAFEGAPETLAQTVFSAMEGALIIGRALDRPDHLASVTAQVRAMTGAR